jgi:replicative DNA helicase
MTPQPTDPTAERIILAAMLDMPDQLAEIVQLTRSDWFSRHPLRLARDVIARRWRASQPADMAIVLSELAASLDAAEMHEVRECLLDPATLDAKAVRHWISQLERSHHCRQAHYAAHDLIRMAADADTATSELQAAVGKLAQDLTTAKGFVERREWIERTLDQIQAAAERDGNLAGPSWGILALDDATGGIQGGKLVVVAGPTGGGKSALAMHFALECARQGAPALFWSLEMPGEDMMLRMMAATGEVDALKAQRGAITVEDSQGIARGAMIMRDRPIEIIDDVLAFDDLLAVVRAQVQQRSLAMVVIDYIQIIPPSNRRHPSKERELAEMSSTLAKLSKDLDICVVVLSQLNDNGDLSQARAIGHDANLVIKLDAFDDEMPPPYDITANVPKNRGGPRIKFSLDFDAPSYRFSPA